MAVAGGCGWSFCRELVHLHPGRLTWNLQITHLERKMIFQTSMIMFHVNLQRCKIRTLGPFKPWVFCQSNLKLVESLLSSRLGWLGVCYSKSGVTFLVDIQTLCFPRNLSFLEHRNDLSEIVTNRRKSRTPELLFQIRVCFSYALKMFLFSNNLLRNHWITHFGEGQARL